MPSTHPFSPRWPGAKIVLLATLVWTLLVLASLLTQREQLNRTASALARIDAVANLKKDMSIRKWASDVGGVFIREEKIPPVNSLEEEERVTVLRSNGETIRLVTVTPIHLLLAIQEAANQGVPGSRERLTSKQLRNMDNAPDDWEAKALDALEKGGDMVAEALPKKGAHGLMRAMIPMRMEKECLECHRDTLVPVGGLRGGATISINLNAYRTAQEPTWRAIQYWHLGIWILGLAAMFTFAYFARHRSIEKLRSEEARRENEMAFAAMAEGAIITDPSGTILWVNDAFCRISGYTRDEVINRNPRLLKSGVHDADFYRKLWEQLTRVGHWRGELWNRRKTGDVFPEEISIQALTGPDGRIRRFISIFSDITERKRDEQELQEYREHLEDLVRQRTEELTEARDEAEAANRSKTTFLANMSHELRTPLNAVIGFSQLMGKDPVLDPTQRRNVEIINNSGNHLLTLINDILELSKIESGKMEMAAEDVDLAALLEEIVGMMRLRAEQGGLALKLEMSDLPPSVVLDPVMLRQILLNLLSNAVKFTPAGSVTLNVAGTDAGNGEVRLSFSVVDTGIGIRAEDHARIFASFEQVGASHQGGTGLGLTISQQYVEMMGGELTLESEPGQGATFRFAITVPGGQAGSAKSARGRVSGVEPADHGRRILVVDDMPEARLLVRSLLEPLGFVVDEASSAAAAEAAIATAGPDLVFMDWFLPDGNGLEIIARVRQGKTGNQPRLVMLTANAMKESRQAALLAGADDFLSKPFEEEALFRILEKHLALRLIRAPLPTPEASPCSVGAARKISAEDLAGLCSETRAGLAQAALSLNPEKIAAALRSVAEENPELAANLGEFANTRQYQALWQVLGILDAEE
ncbi:ATP-binding protein [Dechloromonas denitrificans]|uniref:ATP-binding protein n=1 Tax=Dechloromonas denitrificans TaxID=281362 RepID=UPI001CF9A4F7|nr:ATP-binding protein [Dechloromonas denitrificans]UCV09714.1 response regulator [Dechloromonas denitrificans]